MAVALVDDAEPVIDSFPSSPFRNSESEASDGLLPVSGSIEPSECNYQSDSSVQSRKEYDSQSLAYLRSEEYRLLFRLPADETLVQDFNCAFQESILLQGHMYLFGRRICFYSNIFGFETKKTIHFNEVTCVRKAKTAGIFPNAIEIVSGEKKYFFASFLSRDEAYRLIVDRWSQHTNGSEILIDHQELKSEIRNDNGLVIPEKVKDFEQTSEVHPYNSNKDADISGECKLVSNTEDEVAVLTSALEDQQNREEDSEPVASVVSLPPKEPFCWKVENTDAPTVPEYFTKVAESTFPIQVDEFFNLFFSDKAINFTDAFHRISGDKDFRCTTWSAHALFGHTREVSFQHPIKIYFGAKFGHCHEVQKFRVYNNSHLVIETSQEIRDVPYADYFRVEGFWDVEKDRNETNACVLRVHVNVAFSKRTMWKGKIEQSTVEECKEAYSVWIDNAHEILKQKQPKNPDGEASVTPVKQNDATFEGNEREVSSLTRLHDTNTLMQIPLMASDTKHVSVQLDNSVHQGFSAASFGLLFKESLGRFALYLKSQNHLSLVLVMASVLIILMQLSIILLLSRAPQVHLVSQTEHLNNIVSGRNDMAEAEAWLERRVHYLKDEMNMVDTQLEKMRHEHALLKEHFKGLEQFRKSRQ